MAGPDIRASGGDPMAKRKNIDRTPRVNITYNVYSGGAKEERELPFVVGVLADLSGNPEAPLPRLRDRERKFVEIDGNNFDAVLAGVRPRIKIDVANTLEEGAEPSRLGVELNIRRMSDFEPAGVARQIPELRELLEARDRLANMLSQMELKPRFADALSEIIRETESRKERPDGSATGRPSGEQEGSGS
jgi:type VI secretion system protein ImpB